MVNRDELRAKIYGRFGNQRKFADALNWDQNKISRILNGKTKPDIEDCAKIAVKLALSEQEYFQIFLLGLTPNGDNLMNRSHSA